MTQPWATLVVLGEKRIETRDWATSYRGRIAVHAAKGYPKEAKAFRNHPVVEDALRRHGLLVEPLPLGAVVGTVEVVDCVRVDSPKWVAMERGMDPREWIWGNLEEGEGRVAWMLFRPERFSEPVPAKGALGIWEWKDEALGAGRKAQVAS